MKREPLPEQVVTLVSDILEKIAMNCGYKNGETGRTAAAKRRREKERAHHEREGQDALSNLTKARRLSKHDAEALAKNLHPEVEKLKKFLKQEGIGLGEFCVQAGLATEGDYSKALYRLTLGPDQDPSKRRPYRTAQKYLQLIEAMCALTHESMGIVADRIVIGSSLHPKNAAEWNETQMVHAILQQTVDDVDKKFELYGKFMEVAKLKAAHVASGGRTTWPFNVLDEDVLETYDKDADDVATASDPRYAYWWNDTNSPPSGYDKETWLFIGQANMIIDEKIFFLPHAFIGMLDPDNHYGSEAGDLMGWVPLDAWNEVAKEPIPEPMPSDNSEDYLWCDDWWLSNIWLMVYPSPTESRLVPIFFMPSWGGAIIEILDVRTLDSLRKRQWLGKGRTTTAFERIKELLGFIPDSDELGENKIRSSLVRTAPWFDFNPIYKLKCKKEANDKHLEKLFMREMNW